MLYFTLRRLGLAALVALTVSILAFLLLHLSGDPALALAGEGARQADIDMIRKTYGLDRPIIVQYADWLWHILQGDFGTSVYFKTEAGPLILSKLATTLKLGMAALAFALFISIPLGVLAALYKGSLIDRVCLAIAVLGQALPNFFFALILIMLFSISLRILPVSGSGTWQHFVMPAIALGYYVAPAFMRLIRAGMIEVLGADYIRTARAKGLPENTVLYKHALRNGVLPVVTMLGLQFGNVLAGAILVETVFNWPGLGRLAFDSVLRRDYPTLLGILLFASLLVVVMNQLTDLAYRLIDPRIKTS